MRALVMTSVAVAAKENAPTLEPTDQSRHVLVVRPGVDLRGPRQRDRNHCRRRAPQRVRERARPGAREHARTRNIAISSSRAEGLHALLEPGRAHRVRADRHAAHGADAPSNVLRP
jgi:hypothetical protein